MRTLTLTSAIALVCLCMPAAPQGAERISRNAVVATHIEAAAATLASAQRDALSNIADEDRRTLAMTFYLRAGTSIEARWAWSDARIAAYRQSAESTATQTEIVKIAALFAKDNPGYVLYANTEVRSLERQIERWQAVKSVGVAADELKLAVQAHLEKVDAVSDVSIKRFREFLMRWRTSRPITLAAPGLSLHGQGRAFDFQVRDTKGRTIAGTETATIASVWRRQGWAEKVERAVHAGSNAFVGPLARPDEPWHFEYRPSLHVE